MEITSSCGHGFISWAQKAQGLYMSNRPYSFPVDQDPRPSAFTPQLDYFKNHWNVFISLYFIRNWGKRSTVTSILCPYPIRNSGSTLLGTLRYLLSSCLLYWFLICKGYVTQRLYFSSHFVMGYNIEKNIQNNPVQLCEFSLLKVPGESLSGPFPIGKPNICHLSFQELCKREGF